MSRYYIFTEEQLQDAILAWDAPASARIAVCAFLDSKVAIERGMARDIAAPEVPEIHVSVRRTRLPEEPTP